MTSWSARDLGTPADRLMRTKHNRGLPAGCKLWPSVPAGAVMGEVRFALPARRATLSDGQGGTLATNCVIARSWLPARCKTDRHV